jgi:hypothetical protein
MAGQVRIPNTVPPGQGTALPVEAPYWSRTANKNPNDKEAQAQGEAKGSGAAGVLQGLVGQRRLCLPVL